jgi:hypothetical protein
MFISIDILCQMTPQKAAMTKVTNFYAGGDLLELQ